MFVKLSTGRVCGGRSRGRRESKAAGRRRASGIESLAGRGGKMEAWALRHDKRHLHNEIRELKSLQHPWQSSSQRVMAISILVFRQNLPSI